MKDFRIEILKGNEAGSQFRITGARVILGRAPDCDIVVTDQSVSRTHSELIKIEDGFLLKDLKSSNGVYVNGKKVAEHFLASGDVFTIGNHAYRYIEIESVPEPRVFSGTPEGTVPGISMGRSSQQINVPGAGVDGAKKKRLILYGGVGFIFLLMILFLMMGVEEPKKETKEGVSSKLNTEDKTSAEDDITEDDEAFSSKVPEDMRDFFKKANDFYFEGRRELRMENYVRALESFRKAVTFYPRHQRANYYIKFLNEKLREESQRHLNIGKKMLEQKRYDDAIRSFNEVMNLNLKEQGSVFFKEAERLRGIAEKRKQVVIE
jgi:hypothetical protein